MAVSKVELANGEVLMDLTGDSVTPDTLAEGETAHDATGEPIVGRMKSGGVASVQSDWKQTDETAADFIKNKPIIIEGGDTLTWDGNMEGRTFVEIPDSGGVCFVHVSNASPQIGSDLSYGDFIGGGSIILGSGSESQTMGFSPTDLSAPTDKVVMHYGMAFVAVAEGGQEVDGLVFPYKGTYFYYVPAEVTGGGVMFTKSLTINGFSGYGKEVINPEYLSSNQAVFYSLGSDRYLYTDPGMTTKATREDIVVAAKKQIAISLDGMAFFFAFTVNAKRNWADVYIGIPDGENLTFQRYYTAEYTPETT